MRVVTPNPLSVDHEWVECIIVTGPHMVAKRTVTGEIVMEECVTIIVKGQTVDVPTHLVQTC